MTVTPTVTNENWLSHVGHVSLQFSHRVEANILDLLQLTSVNCRLTSMKPSYSLVFYMSHVTDALMAAAGGQEPRSPFSSLDLAVFQFESSHSR